MAVLFWYICDFTFLILQSGSYGIGLKTTARLLQLGPFTACVFTKTLSMYLEDLAWLMVAMHNNPTQQALTICGLAMLQNTSSRDTFLPVVEYSRKFRWRYYNSF